MPSLKSHVCALFTAAAALGVPVSAAAAPQIINGDLSGAFNFSGDVIVTGSIKKGARVRIKDGGIIVRKNLETEAVIVQSDSRPQKSGSMVLNGSRSC